MLRPIGALIGLTTEAVAHHKEKKRQLEGGKNLSPTISQESSSGYRSESPSRDIARSKSPSHDIKEKSDIESDSGSDVEGDLRDWDLDDAAAELEQSDSAPPTYEQSQAEPIEDVISKFRNLHPAAFQVRKHEEIPLPAPVILPQRRPKDRSRGFVRAYAPILGDCKGIDQDTFMNFLKDFHRSSQASPVFDIINVACFAVGAVPNPIAMGVSIGVQIINNTGKELQTRHRTNSYLQRINESLFMPHGLYCLIMTYKPDQPGQQYVEFDMNETNAMHVTKALSHPDNQMRNQLKNIRLKDGETIGDFALPESAPLIYPALDRAAMNDQPLSAEKQNKLKSSKKFLADYMDRRGQAKYAAMNPNSKLAAAPDKQFSSRFADPNHPVNNGGLITFLSGGTIDLGSRKRERRAAKAERKAAKYGRVLTEEEKRRVAWKLDKKENPKGIRRIMTQNVFYMMICNMPTEEQMAMARDQIQATKAAKRAY